MEIHFENWSISITQHSKIAQFDNGCHTIFITGDIPTGYSWDLLVQSVSTGQMNTISLVQLENSLSVTLSANDLAKDGCYNMQLRGISSDTSAICRHTNIVTFLVDRSLSGDLTWPTLPTEFSQCENRIRAINAHPPKPDDNGFWQVWNVDSQTYQSTDLPIGLQGLKGDPFTYADFTAEQLATLKGADGTNGANGADGRDGIDGQNGVDGKSAYTAAVEAGYTGTEAQFNTALAAVADKYEKPSSGIPDSDIASASTWNAKQNALTAGINIDITSNVIKTKVIPCSPNLLDNWLFRAGYTVNQRGVSGTVSTVGYFIDRWKLTSGSVTINSNGTLTLNGTMVQILENAIGQTVTATALTSNGISEVVPTYNDTTKTLTVTANNKTLIAMKLEAGSTQTLVHQEGSTWVLNETPDYGAQLQKCYRYYQILDGGISQAARAYNTSYVAMRCEFLAPMRTVPTVSWSGTLTDCLGVAGEGTITPTSATPAQIGIDNCRITFGGTLSTEKTYTVKYPVIHFVLSADL